MSVQSPSDAPRLTTSAITTHAVFIAIVAVLGYVALDFGNLKITFESLPILLSALLAGPLAGFTVGTLGTLIYQLLRYGITATTALWILPYTLAGLFAGFCAKKYSFKLSTKTILLIVVCTELLITILNTGALYIDARIYGYYHPALISGMLIPRFFLAAGKGIVFGLLIPRLLQALRTFVR